MKRKIILLLTAVIGVSFLTIFSGCSKVNNPNVNLTKSTSTETLSKNVAVSDTNSPKDTATDGTSPSTTQNDATQTVNSLNSIYKQTDSSAAKQAVPNNKATTSATAKPAVTTAPVKKQPTAAPAAAKSTKTSAVASVNVTASASPSNVQAMSAQAVPIYSNDSLYSQVVSTVSTATDLVIKLQDSQNKDDIVSNVLKDVAKAGYSGYISAIQYSCTDNILIITYNYKGGKAHFLTNINAVNAKVNSIVNSVIKSGMSDYDKEIALHDYLVNNCVYDYTNLVNNSVPDDSFTAYGALLKGTAVCEGYAEAMYRLLNKASVNSLIVTGTADNTPHAWNLAYINGQYYQLDATFDDPVSSNGNVLSYNYFNITDAQISKDHSWNASDYPKCTSTSANYFVHNNLVANNKTDFYNIVKSGLQNKTAIIRVKTATYDPNTYSPSIVYTIIQDNPSINYVDTSSGLSYDYDSNSCVMDIYVKYK